jgi:hypothetical protein
LPLVSKKSTASVEAKGQQTRLQILQLGNSSRLLELLRLVS